MSKTIINKNQTSGLADTSLSNITDTGTSAVAGWAMPSNTFVDLTIPASGTVLIAPADGYVMARQEGDGRYSLGSLSQNVDAPENLKCFYYNNDGYAATIPVKKGDYFVWYYFTTPVKLRFIYATGSESEYTPS